MAISPRTAKVDILQGEDDERINDLFQSLQSAKQAHADFAASGAPSRGDDLPSITEAQDALRAAIAEADERAVTVRLRSIGRGRFRDLRSEHPPRKVKETVDDVTREVTHEDDAPYGVNVETFPEALLSYADTDDPDVRTIVEPEFNTAKERKNFLDNDLAEGDFEKLWTTAFYLNAQPGADPKGLTRSVESLM